MDFIKYADKYNLAEAAEIVYGPLKEALQHSYRDGKPIRSFCKPRAPRITPSDVELIYSIMPAGSKLRSLAAQGALSNNGTHASYVKQEQEVEGFASEMLLQVRESLKSDIKWTDPISDAQRKWCRKSRWVLAGFQSTGMNVQASRYFRNMETLVIGHAGIVRGKGFIYWNNCSGSGYCKDMGTLVMGYIGTGLGNAFHLLMWYRRVWGMTQANTSRGYGNAVREWENTAKKNHLNLHLSETMFPHSDEGCGAILAIVHENDPD
jgi:hypothetical protein